MTKRRKNYTPEEKVAILKTHLVKKVPVSDLCDELGLNPTEVAGSWPARLDFRRLRREVSMAGVLHHLGYFDSLRGFGLQRRGPCPLYDSAEDRHRSFSVNLPKGVFRCFHPPCQAAGNTLDLWAAVHRLPIDQAARHPAQTSALGLTISTQPTLS